MTYSSAKRICLGFRGRLLIPYPSAPTRHGPSGSAKAPNRKARRSLATQGDDAQRYRCRKAHEQPTAPTGRRYHLPAVASLQTSRPEASLFASPSPPPAFFLAETSSFQPRSIPTTPPRILYACATWLVKRLGDDLIAQDRGSLCVVIQHTESAPHPFGVEPELFGTLGQSIPSDDVLPIAAPSGVSRPPEPGSDSLGLWSTT